VTETRRFSEDPGPGTRLVVAREYREEVLSLGLRGPGALEALLAAGSPQPGGRAGVWHVVLPESGRVLHVRVFAHGGWMRRLTGRRLFRLARPLAELEATAHLRARGVAVPAPAFVLGERAGPTWRAALATALEPGTVSGGRFLASAPSPRVLTRAARAAGRAVRALHDAGARHADLHVDNLLVAVRPNDAPRVVITDLDRARIVGAVDDARRMAELMRLHRSLVKRGLDPGVRAHAAFLAAYTGPDRPLRAGLLRHLPHEHARLRRHALLYRKPPERRLPG